MTAITSPRPSIVSVYDGRRRLLAGTPRIDLDGNPAGTGTVEGATRARAAVEARAKARAAARKESAPQFKTPQPKRGDGLAALKAAALRRKTGVAA